MAKISDYVEVRNSKVASRYAKDKVQAGQWVEDYMNGDIDMKGDLMDFIDNIKEVCKFGFVGHHYKFFVTEFIPEVLSHSKKMDEATIKSHYEDMGKQQDENLAKKKELVSQMERIAALDIQNHNTWKKKTEIN